MVLAPDISIPTLPSLEELDKSGAQILRERTEQFSKSRVEDHEISDTDMVSTSLNAVMYKGGYVRRNRGWELSPKKLGQSRAKLVAGVQPGPSFVRRAEQNGTGEFAPDDAQTENSVPVIARIVEQAARASDRAGDVIPPVSVPVKEPARNQPTPPIADTSAGLEDLKTQMRDVAIGLGINVKSATAMSNFLAGSFDVQNPETLWAGLSEVTEIHPSMRKRFWRTWASLSGLGIPVELQQKVEQQTNTAMGRKEDVPGLKKRYVAVDGQVVDADSDDDSGMSFSQALQLARLQNEKYAAEIGGGVSEKEATLSTALTIISESNKSNTLALVEMLKDRNGNGGGNNELMLQLITAKNEAAEARMLGVIQASNQVVGEGLKAISEAMRTMAAGTATRKSWLEELMTEVPEAREKFFKGLFGGGNDNAVRISMPGAVGPDGQAIGVPLDAYMRLEELTSRKETIKAIREGLPDMVKIGERIVGALQTNAEAQKIAAEKGITLGSGEKAPTGRITNISVVEQQPAEQATESEPESTPEQEFDPNTMGTAECIGCHATLAYPKTVKTFGCPSCDAVMENPDVQPASTSTLPKSTVPQYDPRNNPPRPRIRPIIGGARSG